MNVLERRRVNPTDKFAIPVEKPCSGIADEPTLLEIESERNPSPSPGSPLALIRATRYRGLQLDRSISFALYCGPHLVAYEDLGTISHSMLAGEILWVPTAQENNHWGIPMRVQSFFPTQSRGAFGYHSSKASEALRFDLLYLRLLAVELAQWDKDIAAFLPYLSNS